MDPDYRGDDDVLEGHRRFRGPDRRRRMYNFLRMRMSGLVVDSTRNQDNYSAYVVVPGVDDVGYRIVVVHVRNTCLEVEA
jgi:hypothetical protein